MVKTADSMGSLDVWTILPVKSLSESKGRLAHLLSSESRVQLMHHLLHHVLATIQKIPRITQTLVISRDPKVWQTARAYGALVLEETVPYGLNNAVARAYEFAADSGASATLILPVDLPFVKTADINLILDSGLGIGSENGSGIMTTMEFTPELAKPANLVQPVMSICTDRRGDGTNGLLLNPSVDFEFHYGVNSLNAHIREAVERNYLVRLVNAAGLQFDLDIEEDWQIYSKGERSKLSNSVI